MAEQDTLRSELAVAFGGDVEPAAHPDEGELLAYSCGELEGDSAERVADHLAACRSCLELVLDMEGFLAPEAAESAAVELQIAEIQTARAWHDLRAELSSPARTRGGSAWRSLALAATVLLALGLGALAMYQQRLADRLRDQIAQLDVPQADAPIVDLFPVGTVRAGGVEAPASIPDDAAFVVLVLNLPGESEHGRYSAKLLDAAGEVLWTGALVRSEYGTFRLGVPRRWLGQGDRRVSLYGDGELLESYALRAGGAVEGR